MSLFDTHFHLDLQKDIHESLAEIDKNGIYTIIVTNLPDLFGKERNQYNSKFVRLALGLHPELVSKYRNQIPMMWKFLSETKYIGEVGLDYSPGLDRTLQTNFFSDLIENCRNHKKIITIHSRKASHDVLNIIGKNFDFTPILHWFSGPVSDLRLAIARGFYFSVNINMLHSTNFMSKLDDIPQNRLLLETDSPFGGLGYTHKEALLEVVSGLALHYSISVSEMEKKLCNNFKQLLLKTL